MEHQAMTTDHKQQARELLAAEYAREGITGGVMPELFQADAAALRAIEAALAQSAQQAGAVPEGWVLVPLEMTDEMAVAFIEGSPSVRKAWQDAIAAAPPALSDGRQG